MIVFGLAEKKLMCFYDKILYKRNALKSYVCTTLQSDMTVGHKKDLNTSQSSYNAVI